MNMQNGFDQFDREYNLKDLVAVEVLADTQNELKALGIGYFQVFSPDGSVYYSGIAELHADNTAITEHLTRETISTPKTLWLKPHCFIATPIEHQLERLGYFVLGTSDTTEKSISRMQAIGRLTHILLSHIMTHTCKNLMTSALHGRIVEESYEALQQKTENLAKSEQKYRRLAENLEHEVKRKTEKIKNAQSQMMHQEKLASIGQLAAGVAHEINNPMAFITSNLISLRKYNRDLKTFITERDQLTQTITKQCANSSGPPEVIATIRQMDDLKEKMDIDYILEDLVEIVNESIDGAERINKIVQDLKDFAHPGEETASEVDIHLNIDSTLNIVRNELKYKAEIIKQYGTLPFVTCFPRQINQVIMNLLVNAAHAIPDKGIITISTKAHASEIELSISDTGVGIPEEHLNKIFDPFFTTKDIGKGTGLGLNLVYGIIENHNGRIQVESSPGDGTTFHIFLPIIPEGTPE